MLLQLVLTKRNKCGIGWSHRAIFGFTIGSKVKVGDCGFEPSNEGEFIKSLRELYKNNYDEYNLTIVKNGIKIDYKTEKDNWFSFVEPFPTEWGRGEWEAKTLDDAKQMAINFARDVS